MCGISCLLSPKNSISNERIVLSNLRRRGPDAFREEIIQVNEYWIGSFSASILHTQGNSIAQQPVITPNHVFLWNGDVFNREMVTNNISDVSDTAILSKWLEENDGDILQLVEKLSGPYSFIYLNRQKNLLWIGRDVLGRHSLLWEVDEYHIFVSSVGHKSFENFREVPASGVFCFSVNEATITNACLYRWSHYEFASNDFSSTDLKISEQILDYFNFQLNWGDYNQFFFVNVDEDFLNAMRQLILNENILNYVKKLSDLLWNSVKKRVTVQRNKCINCVSSKCSPNHTKIGVLFSGGLDSTIVAILADKFVPEEEPIDLFNVAFHKNGTYNVPDRLTGISSLNELRQLCPTRNWNFVEINITQEELVRKREDHISHLIHPLKTILDESLGCALWFASRGEGCVNNIPYKSSAKIILLGTGADEQLGGYVRHRNILKREGWKALGYQLIKETLDISKRNLGRDDRVASDHGRQPRFPFLDESLVKFLAELAPWQKCELNSLPQGLGDKLLLRLVAVRLGLNQCCTFPKRAFQFGCRIANSKEKGDNYSNRL